MPNLNKVLLMGHLTRDPELKYTPSNTSVVSCGLAINRRWKNAGGEQQEEVTFVDFEAWGKTAEVIADHLKKGEPVFIEGRLKLDQWEDKESGAKRSKLKVVVESFQFVGGKQEGQGGQQDGGRQRPAASTGKRAGEHAPASQGDHQPVPEEDIPF